LGAVVAVEGESVSIDLVLFIIAAVCFALAALKIGTDKVELIAVGLLAWVLTNIVG